MGAAEKVGVKLVKELMAGARAGSVASPGRNETLPRLKDPTNTHSASI